MMPESTVPPPVGTTTIELVARVHRNDGTVQTAQHQEQIIEGDDNEVMVQWVWNGLINKMRDIISMPPVSRKTHAFVEREEALLTVDNWHAAVALSERLGDWNILRAAVEGYRNQVNHWLTPDTSQEQR
jgi:hypothetical protein